jgi:hypothetical protein
MYIKVILFITCSLKFYSQEKANNYKVIEFCHAVLWLIASWEKGRWKGRFLQDGYTQQLAETTAVAGSRAKLDRAIGRTIGTTGTFDRRAAA